MIVIIIEYVIVIANNDVVKGSSRICCYIKDMNKEVVS